MDSSNAMVSSTSRVSPRIQDQFKVKRRGLRRGTHSCWECKRRKMKCLFDPLVNANVCHGCRRRGSPCISQEYPEELANDLGLASMVGAAVGRVGSLSASSTGISPRAPISPVSHAEPKGTEGGPPTPASMGSESSRQPTLHHSPQYRMAQSNPESAFPSTFQRLSRFLWESLPSREDTERIYRANPHPDLPAHDIMTMPYTCLIQNDLERPEGLLEIPGPDAHPVQIARHMLLLASSLQHLHPDVHKEVRGLAESPRVMSERLASLANDNVTTKDNFLGSIEGLECIMIESVYQANLGSLRRSWLAGRRAVSVAQLMGLNRTDHRAQYEVLDSRRSHNPQVMWSRIVFLDRFLCLMLGLPQSCTDRNMAPEALLTTNLPMEQLERIHCVVASRILERNASDPSAHDLALTRTLDLELQKAARSVPSKWWLTPKLDAASNDSRTLFWNTGRLFAQVLHYNLLNQLHLPYMLRSSSTDRTYEYSRVTCVNASREVLVRFIALRSFNGIASSCRIVDFLALMAAMTLLLAHMDSQLGGAENLLAHQYHSDRAMIEQVQESMTDVDRLNADPLSAHSADLLRRLLAVDVDAADGAGRVSVHPETGSNPRDDGASVSVHIPYFGIIKIARERFDRLGGDQDRQAQQRQPQTVRRSIETAGNSTQAFLGSNPQPRHPADARAVPSFETMSLLDRTDNHPAVSNTQPGAFAPLMEDSVMQEEDQLQDDFPGLAAGLDDWAFQGVDLAFFDSLMRSAAEEAGGRAAHS